MIRIESLVPKINNTISDGIKEIAADSVKRIQDSISTQGDYRHHSLPGDPPFYQSGDLSSSIGFTASQTTNDVEIHAHAAHAVYLEFGTRRMDQRPFMRPEFNRLKNVLLGEMAKYFAAHFRM